MNLTNQLLDHDIDVEEENVAFFYLPCPCLGTSPVQTRRKRRRYEGAEVILESRDFNISSCMTDTNLSSNFDYSCLPSGQD